MRPADEAADGCPSSRSETKKCPGLNLTVQTGLSIQTGALVLGGGEKSAASGCFRFCSTQLRTERFCIIIRMPRRNIPFRWFHFLGSFCLRLCSLMELNGMFWRSADTRSFCSGTFLQIYGSGCQSLSGLVSVIHVPGPDCQPSGCQSGSGIILLFRRSSQRLSVFLRHGPGCAQSRTRKSDHCIPQDPRFHP